MAEIREIHGNIFATKCDVIVNTVNCVGVMGAGVALECRYRFPGLFEFYEPSCTSHQLEPGKLLLFRDSQPHILCFPTKKHWKDPAKIEYIEAGLKKFVSTYKDRGIRSIAFPHLGCSHGGLSWEHEVSAIVYKYLEHISDITIEIYSFDPFSSDPLYDRLSDRLHSLSHTAIANALGLRTQQTNRLMTAIESGEIHNMLSLQKIPGVGTKTIVKLYDFLNNNKPIENQMDLSFGD